jgi:YD repeat-containing protein
VSRVVLTDASNVTYSDTRSHYDGRDDEINNTPTKGALTLAQVLTGTGNQTIDTFITYDTYGNTKTVTTYDDYGQVNSINRPINPYISSTTYDPEVHTYPTLTTNPLGWETSTQYNYALGLPVQVTDPNGWVTSTTYDGLGRTLSTTAPGMTQPGVYYTYPIVSRRTMLKCKS